jgi:hypothetical protein
MIDICINPITKDNLTLLHKIFGLSDNSQDDDDNLDPVVFLFALFHSAARLHAAPLTCPSGLPLRSI